MTNGDGDDRGDGPASKPKRVRTGCLTCRERHLKCDEGLPHCNNCKKSNRTCKRGVKLNFIDTWVDKPPTIVTLYGSQDWRVEFLDESREIASEYQGGVQKYKALDQEASRRVAPDTGIPFNYPTTVPPAPVATHQPSQPVENALPDPYSNANPPRQQITNAFEPQPQPQQQAQQQSKYAGIPPNSGSTAHDSSYGSSGHNTNSGSITAFESNRHTPSVVSEKRDFLSSQEETLFMQVFVEEVGLWMDSLDSMKHFSRLLPFHSLSEPMLLNAFLACGARHLVLVNPAYNEEKALHYYDTATSHLLKALQNPDRDTVVCATTAVILNVYEVMSERALQRMNHIAGARALIKECGWNARAVGIGAACFWLNVGLEVLSCLHFNWQVAWDPDDWGIDLDFGREIYNGREEVWCHRMLYVVAKICNFRATIPRTCEQDPRDEQIRTQRRYEDWTSLKNMADAWHAGIPRTMHPMAYVHAQNTSSASLFPEVWLIKRTTIVSRLFYHMAQLLLSQTNPYYSPSGNQEMADLQRTHSQTICGIVAHVKDRGVASVAIRSLAHAAEVLTDRREQEEVLQIFDKINKETGWRIGFIYKELKEKWGWNEAPSPGQFAQTHTHAIQQRKESQAQAEQAAQAHLARQSLQLQQDFNYQQQQQQQQQKQQNMTMSMSVPAPPPATLQPSAQPTPPSKRPPPGIPNPLYAKADFNLPQHPYQNFYVAPSAGYGVPPGGSQLYFHF
ncbi:hypothetical protein MBLNU230_g3010t1 [Neophaeotheca triangularis]